MNAPTQAPPAQSSKSGATEAPKPLDSAAVQKRLQQELGSLMCSSDPGVSAFPSGDSLFAWVGTITVSLRSTFPSDHSRENPRFSHTRLTISLEIPPFPPTGRSRHSLRRTHLPSLPCFHLRIPLQTSLSPL